MKISSEITASSITISAESGSNLRQIIETFRLEWRKTVPEQHGLILKKNLHRVEIKSRSFRGKTLVFPTISRNIKCLILQFKIVFLRFKIIK